MRIIAGEWRGRSLKAPGGQGTRPTADRTRESLFSMLVSRLGSFEGLRVADLYAGSGALGLEALSRGAAHATFVDNNVEALAAIRQNVAALRASDRADIRQLSVESFSPAQSFDVVFADPPYVASYGNIVVQAIRAANLIENGGWIAIETEGSETVDPGDWTIEAERRVGRARLTLIRA